MQVLVTGGAGFVGTNLIKRLLKDGHNVVSVDNYSTGKKENEQDGCKYYPLDLSSSITVDTLESIKTASQISKFDVIFHLAAKARIVPSIQNPTKSLFNNIDSTINVLEYARLNNIPVVYAGSSSAHGDIYANPYTFTKWNGEELCKLYENVYNLPIAICRFYNVYGDGQLSEGAYCTVLGIFERLFKAGEPLTITSDGEQRRDFTDVMDIVDGLVRCGRSLLIPNEYNARVSGETFELGNGKNYSINELADAFGDYPREYIPERPGEVRVSLNTDTKAYTMLGWKPKGDIIKYIKENYILDK
jgi:UDP-glucose 4-epimerase